MTTLYEDPHFTFRFADDRLIPRFHLEGVEAGRRVSVFKIDPGTGERLRLPATATVGEGGWVDLAEPIIVKAGDAFIAVELDSSPGNPHGHPKNAHSVLTEHLQDREGTPTRAALDQTLTFFREKLGVGTGPGPEAGE